MIFLSNKPYYHLAQRVSDKTGIPADWVWAQWAHETQGFSSRLTKENNNFGGVTQAEPNGEENKQPDGNMYYKSFASPEDYADYFANYIQLYKKNGVMDAKTMEEYAYALKKGGYYGDSYENYISGMKGILNSEGSFSVKGAFDVTKDAFGARPSHTPITEPTPHNRWTEAKDKFIDAWTDSFFGGGVRLLWTGLNTSDDYNTGKKSITPQDVEFVNKQLEGDYLAQKFVLMNAKNPEHLMMLVGMKKEDQLRQARVEGYEYGLSTFATIGGTLLSDPTNLIPLGQQAVFFKSMARLGKAGKILSTSKLARYSELAATNAIINTMERKGAENVTGNKQDYTTAALIGGVAGAGLGIVGDVFRHMKSKRVEKLVNALENAESHAIAHATDNTLPNGVPKDTKAIFKKLNDVNFTHASPNFTRLVSNDNLFVVSRNDIQKISQQLGIQINPDAKAFYHPTEKYGVLIKDNIKSTDNIDNILAHEFGVHGGLKETVGEAKYNEIMETIKKRIQNPQGDWKEAVRRTPDGGLEEVLGYYIEHAKTTDKLFNKLKANLNKGLRKLGMTEDLSDAEIKEFVKQALQNEVERNKGYHTLDDGTVVINGLKYSNSNLFNPNRLSHLYDIETQAQTQGNFHKLLQPITQWLEQGKFFGTIYGVLSNSVSNTMRKLANDLYHNARMTDYKGALCMPVEQMKKHIKDNLNVYHKQYMDLRSEYISEERLLGIPGVESYAKAQEFNSLVRECYNAKYANSTGGLTPTTYHPIVEEAADTLKKLVLDIEWTGKNSASMFGVTGRKNLLDVNWKPTDGEIWRTLDEDKWLSFVNNYSTNEDAMKFLTDYAIKTAKRDIIRNMLLEQELKKWDIAKLKYDKEVTLYNQNPHQAQPPAPLPPRPTRIDDVVLEDYIKKEAENWALGTIDRDNSNLELKKKGGSEAVLSFLRERFPMDTTIKMDTHYGDSFSFDTHLRSDDMDFMIGRVIDRFSGEAALSNIFYGVDDIANTRIKIQSELDHAVSNQHITPAQRKRELDTFDDGIAKLRGTHNTKDVNGVFDAFGRMFQNLSYSQNGANMGFNQIGEVGGAIAYSSTRMLYHMVPILKDVIHNIMHGKDTAKFIKEAEKKVFGDSLGSVIWQNTSTAQSRIFKEASVLGSNLRHFDKINSVFNFTSRVTSTINMLPKLTDLMIRGSRTEMIIDSIEWAHGRSFNARFSPSKLRAAGITDVLADNIKRDLRKYTKNENVVEFEKWMKDNPLTFFKWKFLIEQQSMRSIQQNTIGNQNILKDSNTFTRLMFQFKDFTLKAVNGQTLRALSSRETDDLLAALFSMATNAGIYAGLTAGRAYAYFPNDEGKRKEYLSKRLNPEEIAYAALFRGVISGSTLSFGRDVYEAATGSQSFRTTVDRTGKPIKQKERDFGDISGDFISQFPAIRAMESTLYTNPKLAYKAAFSKDRMTQEDLKTLSKSLPLQNYLPMVYILGGLIEETHLPHKKTKNN